MSIEIVEVKAYKVGDKLFEAIEDAEKDVQYLKLKDVLSDLYTYGVYRFDNVSTLISLLECNGFEIKAKQQ